MNVGFHHQQATGFDDPGQVAKPNHRVFEVVENVEKPNGVEGAVGRGVEVVDGSVTELGG